VLLAAANCLYSLDRPSGGARLIIHYLITLFAFIPALCSPFPYGHQVRL
jgi:hypothetical protein